MMNRQFQDETLSEMDKLCMHVFDEPRHNTQSLFDQPLGRFRVNLAFVWKRVSKNLAAIGEDVVFQNKW